MDDVHPLTIRSRVGCAPPLDELLLEPTAPLDELLLEPTAPLDELLLQPAPPMPPLVDVLLELLVLPAVPPVLPFLLDPQAIAMLTRGRKASARLLMIRSPSGRSATMMRNTGRSPRSTAAHRG